MLSPWPTDFDVLAQQKSYRNMDIRGLWMAKHGLDWEHSATLSWIQSGSGQNGGPCSSPQIHQLHFCLSKKKATLSFVLWGSRTSAGLCVRTLQRVIYGFIYIYITLVGTRNSAKKVDHPLFTTIHPPPEVQYLKQRYALTCSAHCWSFLRAVGFRWLACIDLYRFVVTKGDPLRFHHHISVIMIMMVQWQSRLS